MVTPKARDSDDEHSTTGVIHIGVSSCLLGEEVRYDGQHKLHHYVRDILGQYFSFVPVCPEVEVGMGVPRETLRLVKGKGKKAPVRLVAKSTGTDHTASMQRFARRRVAQLAKLGLSGYILKKGSPSCGMERVRVYTEHGMPSTSGRGLFADELLRRLSLLPVEEEGRLSDARLRESFIVRVFAYHRLGALFQARWRLRDLVAFQAREKLLLMAHDPAAQKALGRIVANARSLGRTAARENYTEQFMRALAKPATRPRHVNVLHHMLGYLKKSLSPAERQLLLAVIEDFRKGTVPLIVPTTLLHHYVTLLEVDYLQGQSYLEPHPKELMLRNHV